MGAALDAINAPQSLAARRQAASSLPAFELPPPPLSQIATNIAQKYSSFPTSHPPPQATSAVSVGNLLTPLSNSNCDNVSPPGVANNNNQPNNSQSRSEIIPCTPSTYWPSGTGTTLYNTGFLQPWQGSNTLFGSRGIFSPSLGSLLRNDNNPPTAGEGQSLPPPPPFDPNILPPFQSSISMPVPSSSADVLQQSHQQEQHQHHQHHQQQQQQNQHQQQQQQQEERAISNSVIPSPNVMPLGRQSPLTHSSEANSKKASSNPSFYGGPQTSTTQRTGFQYGGQSAVQQNPHHSAAPPTTCLSPRTVQTSMNSTSSQAHFVRPSYPPYALPAMQNSLIPNAPSSGSSMSIVGNIQPGMISQFGGGYPAPCHNLYNSPQHQRQQPVPNDRPYKCDQCPQSFNRNHDLKRHRRIHLAVKPFPCNHCDKSFSRKDALKRHILVKGCGKHGEESGCEDRSTIAEADLSRGAEEAITTKLT